MVIWGPGRLDLEDGSTDVDGTLVCEGRREKDWVRQLVGSTLSRTEIESITSVLENQVNRQVDQPIH